MELRRSRVSGRHGPTTYGSGCCGASRRPSPKLAGSLRARFEAHSDELLLPLLLTAVSASCCGAFSSSRVRRSISALPIRSSCFNRSCEFGATAGPTSPRVGTHTGQAGRVDMMIQGKKAASKWRIGIPNANTTDAHTPDAPFTALRVSPCYRSRGRHGGARRGRGRGRSRSRGRRNRKRVKRFFAGSDGALLQVARQHHLARRKRGVL